MSQQKIQQFALAAVLDKDFSPVVVIERDTQRIRYANEPASALLEFSTSELLNMMFEDIALQKFSSRRTRYALRASSGTCFTVKTAASSIVWDEQMVYVIFINTSDSLSATEIGNSVDIKRAIQKASIVSMADRSGIITYVNNNFEKISGYSEHELIGQNHRIINSGYHPPEFWTNMWKTISSGKFWRADVKNKAKDGCSYWVDTFIIPFMDSEGHVHEFLSIRNDITPQKKAEQRLREAEAKYRNLVEKMPAVVYMASLDKHREMHYISPQVESLLGFTIEEWNTNPFLWSSRLYPEDKTAVLQNLNRCLRQGTAFGSEYRFLTKSNSVLWLKDRATIHYDEHGKPHHLEGILLDITARRQADCKLHELNQRLQIATRAAKMGIWEYQYPNILIWDETMREIFGFPDETDNSAKWWSRLHPDDFSIQKKILDDLQTSGDEYNTEFRIIRCNDNAIRHIKALAVVLRNDQGDLIRLTGVNWDVTEERERENALVRKEEELTQLLKEKDYLIQEIHHRVKNNLQVMSSVLYLKSRTLKSPSMQQLLEEARQRLLSMSSIHERLMQSGGQITQVFVPDYISMLVQDIRSSYALGASDIQIVYTLDDDTASLEPMINCGFIINETVTNAIKHAFPSHGEGVINIRYSVHPGYRELCISDNGRGMPAHATLDNKELFGLQLIKVFVSHLRGSVRLDCIKGTKWTITFPI